MPDSTTITVKNETWEELFELKGRGDSFDDVIRRLLDERGNVAEEVPADAP